MEPAHEPWRAGLVRLRRAPTVRLMSLKPTIELIRLEIRMEQDGKGSPGVSISMAIDVAPAPDQLRVVTPLVAGAASVQFEDLYEQFYTDVFRYAFVLTGSRDDADDVAAETFARAWRMWRLGREAEGPPLPWLLVIARNIATDRWRRLAMAAARLLPQRPPDGYAEVEGVLWIESLTRLLPARQREVITLRFHRDLGDAEIGRIMGLSESGVRSLVARAIEKLRQNPEVWR
jgi:RNA polymerase sigma factor (sigma-70 family)